MGTATMSGVVQFALDPGSVELREIPVPEFAADEVLLRVGAVSVCGSDVHQYHGTPSWRVNVPVVLGHEFTGTVAAVGDGVEGFKEGDRVVSETAARICGQCVFCRSGNYNVCPHRQGFGYGIDGAMAEFVRVPARCLHHIPDSLPFERAAMTEPTCVAYNAVAERSTVKPGMSVLVLGPGPIGLLCLMIARLQGATNLIAAGISSDRARLDLARSLGATRTVDLQQEDLADVIAQTGDGYGVDLVVDAAGVAASFKSAMAAVRPLGQITKVGWGPGPLDASLDPIVQKAVTVNGSFSHNYRTWERVISLLASEQIDPGRLVGMEGGLERWKEGFDSMADGSIPKAVLRP